MYETSKRFSILYSQGVWRGGEKLQPEDSVASILKQGTLSLGFIGLGVFSSFNRKASWRR